ncbi:MAG: hypothetical protein HND40_07880 [Ignavibacteriota bacterium]|nr:hypothetical protein [Ignavibacteriota bacterium]MCO6448170.1 hypothetical protein [Ignavibacterium album]MCZ2267335.1 hypothetical protein [Ignavibacteriales bacterium]QKJ99475.1 MAG: hypothetical protein HND40_07880 [Ignavibacteriota bacterium]HOJ06881.1 hypothetical protein [Ignavibacteriaceae bacterium]
MHIKVNWTPTKYIEKGKTFKVINNKKFVKNVNRFIGEVQAKNYHKIIVAYANGLLLVQYCRNVLVYQMHRNLWADWSNTFHHNLYFDLISNLDKLLTIKNISFSSLFSNLNFYFGKIFSKPFLDKINYSLTFSEYPLGYCLVAKK